MLKKDVMKYLGANGTNKKVAKLLRISEPAVCMWGDIVPKKRAERLHEIFRTEKFTRKHPVTSETPVYDYDFYEQAIIDNKNKNAQHKYRELRDEYGDSDVIGHSAALALKKSNGARTDVRKVEILSTFAKSLIK